MYSFNCQLSSAEIAGVEMALWPFLTDDDGIPRAYTSLTISVDGRLTVEVDA